MSKVTEQDIKNVKEMADAYKKAKERIKKEKKCNSK